MRKNISVLLAGLALFCLIGCVSSPQGASDKGYAPIEVSVPERPAGQQDVIGLFPSWEPFVWDLSVWVCAASVP